MAVIPHLGKLLIVIGIVVTVLGIILLFSGKAPWLGRLPGDFSFKWRSDKPRIEVDKEAIFCFISPTGDGVHHKPPSGLMTPAMK